MARLQEKSTFKDFQDKAFELGKTLSYRRNVPQQQSQQQAPRTSSYPNLRNLSSNSTPQISPQVSPQISQQTPKQFSNLGTITTPYQGSTRYEKSHPAVDIAAPKGTPIGSFTGGTVSEVRTGQKWTKDTPSFGNYIIISLPTGEKIRYSHLYENFVKMGDVIQQGQKIGSIGGTGSTYSQHSKGPGYHLDLRIKNAMGKYINPTTFLNNLKQQ